MRLLLLAVWVLSPCVLAQGYSVSSGTLSFAPLTTATANTVTFSSTGSASGSISPPGFSFSMFGVTHNSINISEFGFISLGGGLMSNKAYNRMDRTDLVAACWDYIAQGTSGICLWQFIAGVLTVEWQNFEWRSYMGTTVPVFSVQLQVDTASGEVECRYAAMTGTLKVPRQQGAVCMMGGMTGSAYKIAFGTAAGLTGDLGEFLQWPTDQYIRFTPVAGAAPSLVVTLDHGAHPTPMPGDILEIKKGTTISSRNIDIAVSDTDMDAVSLEASLGDADGASTMVQSEFESASAATPYVIEPVSGEIHHETYCTITLIARDGTHACVLVFEIRGYTKKKKPEFEISPKTFNLGCATLSSASITGPGAILVLAGLLGLRRRRVRNS